MAQNTLKNQGDMDISVAPAADDITILKCRPGNRAAKRFNVDGTVDGYNADTYFTHVTKRVSDIHTLSTLLSNLETCPERFIVRGGYIGDVDAAPHFAPADQAVQKKRPGYVRQPNEVYRRKAGFEDRPLHMALIDIDNFEPVADPLSTPVEAIEEFISTELPACFHGASFHWQLSNSAGLPKSKGKLKAHVWFWLRTPYASQQLEAWVKGYPAVDKTLFRVVQVHYTAAPVLAPGVVDAVKVRSGFHQGAHDDVDLVFEAPAYEARKVLSDANHSTDLDDEDQRIVDALFDQGMVTGEDDGQYFITCPFVDGHTDGEQGAVSSTSFQLPGGAYPEGRFSCLHGSCTGRSETSFRQSILNDAEDGFEAHDATPAELEHLKQLEQKAEGARKPFLGDLESMRVGASFRTKTPRPRRFVVKGLLPLGVTVVLAAAGGTGKSQFALQTAMSVATGDTLCGKWEVEEPGASLLIFAEDEDAENHTRFHNAFARMTEGDSPEEVARKGDAVDKNFYIKSLAGEDARLLTQDKNGWKVNNRRVQDIIDAAKQIPDLKLIVLDPASRFRAGDENDNQGATHFVQVAERILKATGATVVITAHVNKGAARGGDDSSGAVRGASGLPDGARMTLLMRTMSEPEAKAQRITPADKWRYVRVDTGKFNYGPPVHETWLRKVAGGYLAPHAVQAQEADARQGETAGQTAAGDQAIDRENIVRRVRDSAQMDPPRYYSTNKFRERFAGKAGSMDISDQRMRVLLAEMEEDGWLILGKRPDGLKTKGPSHVLLLGPNAPALPDEWAASDELEVHEDEEVLA
jgi:RecA-family ATPase